jgi:hypothetical protein
LVAIPVSVIGTFTVMQWLGFSINVLTLLALVLAVGLVVDDAIVMLENIYRRMELGEGSRFMPPSLAPAGGVCHHRDHPHPGGGVPAGGLPVGPDRAALL